MAEMLHIEAIGIITSRILLDSFKPILIQSLYLFEEYPL